MGIVLGRPGRALTLGGLIMADDSFAERVFIAGIRKAHLQSVALEALKKATGLLSLVVAQNLMDLRSSSDPLMAACGKNSEQALLIQVLHEIVALLRSAGTAFPRDNAL